MPICDHKTGSDCAPPFANRPCTRPACRKIVHRKTEQVRYRCSVHMNSSLPRRWWVQFKIDETGRSINPGSSEDTDAAR